MKIEYLVSSKTFNQLLSKDKKVQRRLRAAAGVIAAKAEANLAPHHRTGDHHIEVKRIRNREYGHIDWYVSLVGEAPLSVEFGHINHRTGRWVEGLYVLTSAAYL